MCTVVTRWQQDEPVRILAIRDELVSREFDGPGAWWPEQPQAIGGRDRLAGGSWCVSDIASGTCALVLNRTERHTGTPSRGVLSLAALAVGDAWPQHVEHRDMASFTLVLAGPAGVSAWTWDASELIHHKLTAGIHLFTSRGIDTDDAKTRRFSPRFASEDWMDIVTSCVPVDDLSSLVVRHPFETDTYATVFGQLITSAPESLHIEHSRTPWIADGWRAESWPGPGPGPASAAGVTEQVAGIE